MPSVVSYDGLLKNELKHFQQACAAVGGAVDELAKLVARFSAAAAPGPLERLLLRLDGQYPGGDVGCFCIFFLNVVLVFIWIAFAFVVIREHRRMSELDG